LKKSVDALVIGGGPAGSTAAALLARQGIEVALLERERFPRYHVGESLLPSCLPILDLMGAKDLVARAGFQYKGGVHFDWGTETWDFDFSFLPPGQNHSWHVVRADFDAILFEHARESGADAHDGVEVKSIEFVDGRARSARWRDEAGAEGEIAFRYVVDASGRSGLISTRYLKNREYPDIFQNVALWGYWEGGRRLPGGLEGALGTLSIADGWFWYIPFADGRMGVGLVTHKRGFKARRGRSASLEEMYREAIAENELISDLLSDARLTGDLLTDQDFSYNAETYAGPGYLISGDAACFLDPLFSTGVHLGMFSAMIGAAAIGSILRGEVEEAEAFEFYQSSYRHAYLRMMVLVSALYQQYKNKESYFWEAQRLRPAVASDGDLREAFWHIISGLEDLKDASTTVPDQVMEEAVSRQRTLITLSQTENKAEAYAAMTPEEQQSLQARISFHHSLTSRFAESPQTALKGVYLVTKPGLRLAKVEPAPAR
jgi:flavin-dependent dehydrogenase